MSQDRKYFVARNGHTTNNGPYTLEELQDLNKGDFFSANDLWWVKGNPEWLPLTSLSPAQPSNIYTRKKVGFWEKLFDECDEAQKRVDNANAALICPHCQTKGKVTRKRIEQKAGISGGKATAAVLTGGVSLLAVGLSRKEQRTQLHCGNCGSTWLI